MSKKRLLNRLDSLFSNIEEVQPVVLPVDTSQPTGWSWECDLTGIFISCSPEVTYFMGLSPEDFIGKTIFDFKVHPQSVESLKKALSVDGTQDEVIIQYEANAGWIAIRSHIRPQHNNGSTSGYQGFNEVILKPEPPPVQPEKTYKPTLSSRLISPTQPLSKTTQEMGPRITLGEPQPGVGKPKAKRLLNSGSFAAVPWTEQGYQSIRSQRNVIEPAKGNSPAVITLPFNLGGSGEGIIEILDDNPTRIWTEDEQLLAQEIAEQLSLALENSQLYEIVQMELAERIWAEQEILRRNQDLATLNQIGQQLSKLTNQAEILNIIYSTIGQLVDNKNLTIALVDSSTNIIGYPISTRNGDPFIPTTDSLETRLAELLIESKSPIFAPEKVKEVLSERGVTGLDTYPASLLAIPMIAGDRAVGAIIIHNPDQTGTYNYIHIELVSTMASQATTALENANLFKEIRTALEAIESRERYQANVAKAVALLTESGTKALPEVLETLRQAAQNSRIYFALAQEDTEIISWRPVAEWSDTRVAHYFQRPKTQNLPVLQLVEWAKELQTKGWVSGLVEDMPSPVKEMLTDQHITSTLLLAVPGNTKYPSFIAFDEVDRNRIWRMEEVNVLRVVADALSNTIIREDLLNQVQSSLSETENLYNASHRLALANTMQEMVSAITLGIYNPDINRAVLVLFNYDQIGNLDTMRVTANWYSGHDTPPPAVGTEYMASIYQPLFVTTKPLFYDDVESSPFIPHLRDMFLRQNIRSLAILPMWTSKLQIGVLLLQSAEKHTFASREIRSYPPLVDQMVIAVENTRLFEQTQQALMETEVLYKVSSGIAEAATPSDLVNLIAKNLLPRKAERLSLFLVSYDLEGNSTDINYEGYFDIREGYRSRNERIPVASFPLINELPGDYQIIPILKTAPIDDISKETLQDLNMLSLALIPLRSAGRLIGLFSISSDQTVEIEREEAHLVQIAGSSVAVALERQRLLGEAQRRAFELETAARIARDTASTLSLGSLLNQIVSLIKERFGYYHVSIFLTDESGKYAIVREATGEAGEDMKKKGFKLIVNRRSVIGSAIATASYVLVNDTSISSLAVPHPMLPDSKAEIGIPLHLGNQLIGAMGIHANQINAFKPDDVTVLSILADQIAIAIENARAYELSQRAIEDMMEVDRVKSQFLANMSHELRTPLNSIIGFSRVIMKEIDGPINDVQKQDLTAIYNSGQHLLSLINNILDVSKIDAGKMELAIEDISLVDLINGVMSTVVGLVKDKPIQLSKNIPDDLPTVQADSTRIRQVVLNLVGNAAKFTDEGTITIEAFTSTAPNGSSEVMVTVTDTGTGIAQQDQSKLFQPFSQVDDSPTRKTGGTGLGLSICRSLIELHGGRIGLLNSEVGKGSTFYFTLPMVQQVEVTEEPLPAGQNIILSIDDDPQIISLYERYLKLQGFRVIAVTDPKQAVIKARQIKPFAITLDIMMPGKTGWDIIRELKNDPETQNIPVLICSILEEEEKGFNLGASDYLVKPFLQEDLLSAIKRLSIAQETFKVLVIDENQDDIRVIESMLAEKDKYQLALATTYDEAQNALRASNPDVVILNILMNEQQGFSVLEFIHSEKLMSTIPVILISDDKLTETQENLLSSFGEQMLQRCGLEENALMSSLEQALTLIGKHS